MRQQYILSLSILILTIGLHAQDVRTTSYDWEDEPSWETSTLEADEVILLEYQLNDMYFSGENFLEQVTTHKAIYVNSDKSIENQNKQFLPNQGTVEITKEQARVIKPSGEVVDLDTKDIMTYEDEETGASYRYFAMEGLEKGSVIELLVQIVKSPSYRGNRIFFRSDVPIVEKKWEMISPAHLQFVAKSYNGLQEMRVDSTENGDNLYSLIVTDVQPLKNEVQSAYNASREYLIYKLDVDVSSGRRDFASYSQVAKGLHESIYEEQDKKVEKRLAAILKAAGVKTSRDEEGKIRDLESYLKMNFNVIEANAPILNDLDFVTEKSLYSPKGAVFLTANLLKKMEIPHEVVLTSDRFDLPFDKELECYLFLQDFLIYLPEQKKYLAPGEPYLRYGILPPENAGNAGLFISEIAVGDFVSAVAEVRDIPATSAETTVQNLDIEVDMTKDVYEPTIHYSIGQGGYYAQYMQPIYQFLNAEQQKEMIDQQLDYYDEGGDFSEVIVKNERSHSFGQEPMYIDADLSSSTFSESIGDKVLFKVGMLIGRQLEMYQEDEEERQLDLVTDFARHYKREIRIMLPEGYKASGLDKLQMDFQYDQDGYSLAFISDYELTDEVLTISIDEFYQNQVYPRDLFGLYKQVINAAADFNKVSIILEPS